MAGPIPGGVRGIIRRFRLEIVLVSLLAVVVPGVHAANVHLDGHAEDARRTGLVGPLPDGKAIRVLSLGFERLVADLFWLRTIYYIGDERSHAAGYPDLAGLSDLVTDIDPYFRTPYVTLYGVIELMAGDVDAAIALLEKGIRYIDYWKLHFYLGFSYYWDRGDAARAAEQMYIADRLGGGPPYLWRLASRLSSQAGDSETPLLFLRERLRQASTVVERNALEARLRDVWINRDLRAIEEAIEAYRADHAEAPAEVSALVRAGLLATEPRDPDGGRYDIGEDGRAHTDLPYQVLEVHGVSP